MRGVVMLTQNGVDYTFVGLFALPRGGVLLGDPNVNQGAFFHVNRSNFPTSGAWHVWAKPPSCVGDLVELCLYHQNVKNKLAWADETQCPLPFPSASGFVCIVSAAAYAQREKWHVSPEKWAAMSPNASVIVAPFGCFVHATSIAHLSWGTDSTSGLVYGIRIQLKK